MDIKKKYNFEVGETVKLKYPVRDNGGMLHPAGTLIQITVITEKLRWSEEWFKPENGKAWHQDRTTPSNKNFTLRQRFHYVAIPVTDLKRYNNGSIGYVIRQDFSTIEKVKK